MSAVSPPPPASLPAKAFRRAEQLWHTVLNIGIRPDLTIWDKKRIRLLTGISFIALVINSLYCLSYLDAAHRLTFFESFQAVAAYCLILWVVHRHHYNAACHLFNLFNIVSYTVEAITHGAVDAAEYILLPGSVACMLLFRNPRIIGAYFLLNGLCFALCKLSFVYMKPLLFMPNGENLYVPNHILMFAVLFLIVYYFRAENTRQVTLLESQNDSLTLEKQKSDNLLLNILPHETAEELKRTGRAKSRSFEHITVMFTDFKNFTLASENMSPEQLVQEIHYYFCAFDAIMEKYGLEKIKTIGDAYMCAGGLPEENRNSPYDMVQAALEIQAFMAATKQAKQQRHEIFFELRLGIHTGPVVAGVVGAKKFAYDIWGDTVNTASRMESSGEVGKINISGSTHALIKDRYDCTYRGKIEAKNKGQIDMYFVERRLA